LRLAFAATRLASDPDAVTANQRAVEVWEEIRPIYGRICKSKMNWCSRGGEAHHAISDTLLDTLKVKRQEIRKLVAALPTLSSGVDRQPQTAGDRGTFSRTLLSLAETLDSHVERYDDDVLP